MALIKHANLGDLSKCAVVLDLGDLQRQADAILSAARQRAAAELDEARRERERLVAGAAEAGHAQGLARGLAEGRERGFEQGRAEALAANQEAIAKLRASWAAALDGWNAQRDGMLDAARRDVVGLAAMVAEKVTRRAVRLDPSAVVDQMREVLALVLRPSRLVVRVNPADRPLVEAALPEAMARFHNAQHVELMDDPGVERGSCVARLAGSDGEIDASIGTQLERIVAELLPGEASA
ncbi:MAG: hypothetical protein JNJ48_00110 [Phycisphaerae bacterium]|nr:hypothetical protein [Phycisphaerae bacterium]